jgi:uncharacterized protein YecE (DUF72 family)
MRFNGRNTSNWYDTNARDRYDYLYRDEELMIFKKILIEMASNAKLIQIFFNNHAKGSAAINAKKMMIILSEK